MLCLKNYLSIRSCNHSYSGGVNSFLLFYMVLGFYQNYHEIKNLWSGEKAIENRLPPSAPEFVKFIEFYANFDEQHYGF